MGDGWHRPPSVASLSPGCATRPREGPCLVPTAPLCPGLSPLSLPLSSGPSHCSHPTLPRLQQPHPTALPFLSIPTLLFSSLPSVLKTPQKTPKFPQTPTPGAPSCPQLRWRRARLTFSKMAPTPPRGPHCQAALTQDGARLMLTNGAEANRNNPDVASILPSPNMAPRSQCFSMGAKPRCPDVGAAPRAEGAWHRPAGSCVRAEPPAGSGEPRGRSQDGGAGAGPALRGREGPPRSVGWDGPQGGARRSPRRSSRRLRRRSLPGA